MFGWPVQSSASRGARSASAERAKGMSLPVHAGTAMIRVKINRTAMMVKAKIHWKAIAWCRNWPTPRAADKTLRLKPMV